MMNRLLRWDRRRLDLLVAVALFAVWCSVYALTAGPTVTSIYDDSLEFPLVVHRLAIAHPTGYPLYTLVGKLFSFLPLRDVAFRLALLSAVSAAGAVAMLYLAARRFRLHPLGALAAALFLAVSPVFWSQAIVSEVYALNALFVAVILFLTAQWSSAGRQRFTVSAILAFVLGLSLTHHRTIVLMFPALLVYLLLEWRAPEATGEPGAAAQTAATGGEAGKRPIYRQALKLIGLFALPLLLYLYLPWRGDVGSLDGSYENTLQGFVSWVMGGAYSVFLSNNPMKVNALGLSGYLSLLVQQVGAAGLLLAALGLIWLAVNWRWHLLALVGLTWLANVLFVHLYRVADAPVFLIPSFLMVAFVAGVGVHAIAAAAVPERLLRRARLLAGSAVANIRLLVATAAAVLLPALILATNFHDLDSHQNWAVHNYAVDVLSQPLQRGDTVIGFLGEMTLLRYFQEVRGFHPDITTVAADADASRMAAITEAAASGGSVFLTRPLPGLGKDSTLRALGPLLQVNPPAAPENAVQPGNVAAQARFGDEIVLQGYRLSGLTSEMEGQTYPERKSVGSVAASGRLRVDLVWQSLQKINKDYQLTIRLKSPAGRLLAQTDAGPVHGGYPTSLWRPGETVADSHDIVLPVGTPPGLYDLEIGLYDLATLQPLPVGGQEGLLRIGPVSVTRPLQDVNLPGLPLEIPVAGETLLIPGGSFDYSLESIGVQTILLGNLENEFSLYGYGLSSEQLAPGQNVDVTLLWQAKRPPSGDRVVFVQLVDSNGNVLASHESQPNDGLYPTSQWTRNEAVRDIHTLQIPGDIPDGTYQLRTGMYDPSGSPLTALQLTRRSVDHIDLGSVEVRGRQHKQNLPAVQYTVNAQIGNLARLVGFNAGVGWIAGSQPDIVVHPGETVDITLVWRAMEPSSTSYTAFVHLLGPDGQVVSQVDSIPGRGTLPTPSWVPGEVLVDGYTLTVPPTAAPGDYQIEVGLYDASNGDRLSAWDASGAASGDRILLKKVRLEPAP